LAEIEQGDDGNSRASQNTKVVFQILAGRKGDIDHIEHQVTPEHLFKRFRVVAEVLATLKKATDVLDRELIPALLDRLRRILKAGRIEDDHERFAGDLEFHAGDLLRRT